MREVRGASPRARGTISARLRGARLRCRRPRAPRARASARSVDAELGRAPRDPPGLRASRRSPEALARGPRRRNALVQLERVTVAHRARRLKRIDSVTFLAADGDCVLVTTFTAGLRRRRALVAARRHRSSFVERLNGSRLRSSRDERRRRFFPDVSLAPSRATRSTRPMASCRALRCFSCRTSWRVIQREASLDDARSASWERSRRKYKFGRLPRGGLRNPQAS